MSKRNLETFKKKLLAMRSVLVEDAQHMEHDNHSDEGATHHGMTFNHLAEAGTDAFDFDFAMEQLQKAEQSVYRIDEAIKRIDAGTYGICDNCSKKIPKGRLEALPYVNTCVKCQEMIEKGELD